MPADVAATAMGDLGRTPFAHLLVYAVDRHLTGTMVLKQAEGPEHVVQFIGGVPVKVRPSDGYARFGELLLEEGLITAETLAQALATRGLLGDVLLLTGCIEAPMLDWLAQLQFVRRMVHLFELSPETTYHYFDGHDELADWGTEATEVEPLALLWAGLREHGERSTRMQPTLERLGAMPLRLHSAFAAGRFALSSAELPIIAALQQGTSSLSALIASGVAPEPTVRKLVYALVITRYLDLGGASLPVAGEAPSRAPSSLTLGRVQLRSTIHRVGAAAPDPAGDGERAPVVVSRRRRDRPTAQPPAHPTGVTGAVAAAISTELTFETTDTSAAEADQAGSEFVPNDGDRASGVGADPDAIPSSSHRRICSPSLDADPGAGTSSEGDISSVIEISSKEIDAARRHGADAGDGATTSAGVDRGGGDAAHVAEKDEDGSTELWDEPTLEDLPKFTEDFANVGSSGGEGG